MNDAGKGRRYTIRMSIKDPYQAETIQMLDKLMDEGKYQSESDIFREGVRVLYQKEHGSGKRAAERRLIEKYTAKALEYAIPIFAEVTREKLEDVIGSMKVPIVEVKDYEKLPERVKTDDVPKATGGISDSVGDFLDSL